MRMTLLMHFNHSRPLYCKRPNLEDDVAHSGGWCTLHQNERRSWPGGNVTTCPGWMKGHSISPLSGVDCVVLDSSGFQSFQLVRFKSSANDISVCGTHSTHNRHFNERPQTVG